MRPFRPLRRLAQFTTAGLALTAGILIVVPVILVVRSRADVAALNSHGLAVINADRLPGDDGFVELLGRLFVPLGLVSFGLFVVWLYTARRNLDGFAEVRTKWGWGWTFAAWLVPVVNLFAPAAVIADTARESRRSDTGGGTRIGALVWVGWLAFLTVVGMGCYADATRPSRETVTITVSLGSTSDDVMSSARDRYAMLLQPYTPPLFDSIAITLLIGTALGMIALVWSVTLAQHRRAAQEAQ